MSGIIHNVRRSAGRTMTKQAIVSFVQDSANNPSGTLSFTHIRQVWGMSNTCALIQSPQTYRVHTSHTHNIHTHTHSHTYTHAHTHAPTHAHTYTHTHTRTLTHIHLHTHVHIHTCTYTHKHTRPHTHTYARTRTHTRAHARTHKGYSPPPYTYRSNWPFYLYITAYRYKSVQRQAWEARRKAPVTWKRTLLLTCDWRLKQGVLVAALPAWMAPDQIRRLFSSLLPNESILSCQ